MLSVNFVGLRILNSLITNSLKRLYFENVFVIGIVVTLLFKMFFNTYYCSHILFITKVTILNLG